MRPPAFDDLKGKSPFDDVPEADAGGTSVQLYVSLYLILIAFFMVLDSISNQETARAKAVLDSVNSTFQKVHLPKVGVIDLLARKPVDVHHRLFHEEVEGVLTGLIDFPGNFPGPGGNVLRVRLPVATLFDGDALHVRADQTLFLNALADLLKRGQGAQRREIEILITAPHEILSDPASWHDLFVRRAANIAAELEDRGVQGRAISTGLVVADKPSVILEFTSRRGDGG